ncbi:MAG: cupin domain-containing protein [Mycobacteriales bacterium]
MDALAGLLDGPRAQSAFVLRSQLDPPWSLRIKDQAPCTLAAVLRGSGWITPESASPAGLAAGDVTILRGPTPYVVSDEPGTPPQVVILPAQNYAIPDGPQLSDMCDVRLRAWGNSTTGQTALLTGSPRDHRLAAAHT